MRPFGGGATLSPMRRFAFYGKGGIGKSTISASTSFALARRGQRVLHVGCDPKHDSSLVLLEDPAELKTVVELQFGRGDELSRDDLVMPGIAGIDCVESGGPKPGQGCGGRAVARSFDLFERMGLEDDESYDVAVYDVLGDVVCGGFAAPMRQAAGSLVCIVLSEELMACYAANRIAAAVARFANRGVGLAGLIVNLRHNQADLGPVKRFSEALGAPVLQVLPRDPLVGEAELHRRCIVDYAPDSPVARGVAALVDQLLAMDASEQPVPAPLPDHELRDLMRQGLSKADGPPDSTPPTSTITEWSRL